MAFGVLESKRRVVQGTVHLLDANTTSSSGANTGDLKHSKDGKFVLNPQPSDDPNDPLNWPLWQRDGCYALLLMSAVLAALHGIILSPVTLELATQYNKTVNDIAKLSSYMLLTISVCGYPYSIGIRLYGKRIFYILGMTLVLFADVWALCGTGYNSLLGARIISGCGQSVFEILTLGIIPDLYFVHERGSRVAAFILLGQTGISLGTPIFTQIAAASGIRWCWIGLIISESVMLVCLVLFFFEPSYPRQHKDALAHEDEHTGEVDSEQAVRENELEKNAQSHIEHTSTRESLPPKRMTYTQRIKPWSKRYTQQSLFTITWRTLALNLHPTIIWGTAATLPIAWVVAIAFTGAATLAAPPYNFSAVGVGNMFIAAWLGATIALLFAFTLDWFCIALSKRNANIYEPEFRLFYSIPGLVFFLIGTVGWGWGTEAQVPWIGLAFFWALTFGGACLINVSIATYVIDAHRTFATESQVILFVYKNFFGYSLGYFIVPWWEKAGSRNMWGVIAGLSAAMILLGIPVYIYGKRLRAYWMKRPFLGITEMS